MTINFSALDGSTLLGRAVRLPLSLIPAGARFPILQGALRGQRWIVGSGTHGCWLGTYELEQQRVLADNLRAGDVVFDLGAHAGFYTLLASVLVGAHGRVVAFEPVAGNLEYLKEHLRINKAQNVQVIEAAVSDGAGHTRLGRGPSNSMWRMADDGELAVQSVALDELVLGGMLPPPDLIKMDIEGAELRALRGSARIMAAHRPAFLLSTHGSALHRSCCELLQDAGYLLTPIVASKVGDGAEILARHHASPARA